MNAPLPETVCAVVRVYTSGCAANQVARVR